MKEKKVYAVMCILDTLTVMGKDAKLPKGQYVIPVFEEKNAAEEFAGNEHTITELLFKSNNTDDQ